MLNNDIINYVNKLIKELNLTNYIGILVYGSYVGNRTNKLSDLDVMIIKDNYETIELSITLQNSTFTIPQIEKILYKNKISVQKIKVVPSENNDQFENMHLVAKYSGSIPTSQIITEISALKDVFEVAI